MKASSAYRLTFWSLALLSWLYLILRAIYNPLVFDEATSFFLFIKNGSFWPGQGFWSANNHFLNSALSWLSYNALGANEFSLRLANLLAFPLFCLFGFRLMRSLESSFLRWWALGLFFSLHYLLEFFGYSRGYGLMLTAELAALYYLGICFKKGRLRDFYYLGLALLLGALSNISWLPLLGLVGLSSLYLLIQKPIYPKKKIGPALLILAALSYALWISLELKAHQQLYYGGQNGFLSDSLRSLKTAALGPSLHLDIFLAGGALFAIAWVVLLRKGDRSLETLGPGLSFLLLSVFYPMAHLGVGLNFPFDRALIYWLALGLVAFFQTLDKAALYGSASIVLFSLWTLAFPLHYFPSFSFDRASSEGWAQEQIPDRLYHQLSAAKAENFGGTYLHAPQWNFLQQKHQALLPAFQVNQGPWLNFRLSAKEDLKSWQGNYFPIDSTDAGLYLLQRKQRVKKQALQKIKAEAKEEHSAGLSIYEGDLDSAWGAVSTSLRIKVQQPSKLAFAVQASDSTGKVIHWQAFRAREYLSPKKNWQDWRLFVVLKELPQSAERLKLFIWNPENESFSLEESNWTFWKLN